MRSVFTIVWASRLSSEARTQALVVGGVALFEQEANAGCRVREELASGGLLAPVEAGVVVGGRHDGDQVTRVGETAAVLVTLGSCGRVGYGLIAGSNPHSTICYRGRIS